MKRQRDTAIAVYRNDIEPTLHGRQLFIRQQLDAFLSKYQQAPTALELLRYISAQFPLRQFDCNSTRPRLNELEKFGWVKHGAKRRCSVTNKVVLTWELDTPRVPLPEPIPQRLFT